MVSPVFRRLSLLVLVVAASLLGACVGDDPFEPDPPRVEVLYPLSGATLVGQGEVEVEVRVEDASHVTLVELVVAGDVEDSGRPGSGDCRPGVGCRIVLTWDNRALVQGEHTLTVRATDTHGNIGRAELPLTVLDGVYVDRIRVTGMLSDGAFGTDFEVEVHVYDADSGAYLGCAGRNEGMGPADRTDVTYIVGATLIDSSGPLMVEALRDRNLRFVVIENDDARCPAEQTATSTRPLHNDDDLFGESEPVAGASLADGVTLSFSGVSTLTLGVGRP